ncbi:hypothetical protein ACFQYP_27775 [Nonomuraea antimicrobica]
MRGRVTLITTAVAALVLIPVGVAGMAVARTLVAAAVFNDTRDTAERIAFEMRGGALPMGPPSRCPTRRWT